MFIVDRNDLWGHYGFVDEVWVVVAFLLEEAVSLIDVVGGK